jgi:hypothetical protein
MYAQSFRVTSDRLAVFEAREPEAVPGEVRFMEAATGIAASFFLDLLAEFLAVGFVLARMIRAYFFSLWLS